VSTNCGATWNQRYSTTGTSLATAPDVATPFTPTSTAQWRLENINILPFVGSPNIMFKFEFTSGAGNNLYIDDINITSDNVGIPETADDLFSFDVYPNPSAEAFHVVFNMPGYDEAEVKITDLLGREVKTVVNERLVMGMHEYALDARDFSKGIYLVSLKSGGQSIFRKLILD